MRQATFSTVLWCLARNIPLGHLKQWTRERIELEGENYRGGIGFCTAKEIENAGRKIINGLSQYHVAERASQEWELFGPALRMAVTRIANEPGHSGNVRKGIAYFDELTGGKILSRVRVQEERVLKERHGKTFVGYHRSVNAAVAGAERAFAAFTLPRDYNTWFPAKKKAYREQMARERRAAKS